MSPQHRSLDACERGPGCQRLSSLIGKGGPSIVSVKKIETIPFFLTGQFIDIRVSFRALKIWLSEIRPKSFSFGKAFCPIHRLRSVVVPASTSKHPQKWQQRYQPQPSMYVPPLVHVNCLLVSVSNRRCFAGRHSAWESSTALYIAVLSPGRPSISDNKMNMRSRRN